jgi:preprotein translocase subunit SecE
MKMFDGAIRFVRDVYSEMKSVTWPTKDDLKEGTIVVIIMSALVALFLSGVDFIFGLAVRSVF